MTKKGDKLENLKTTIRRQLTKAGTYSQELSQQLDIVATDLLAYRKIRDEALKDETAVLLTETSREGGERIKANPVFSELRRQSDVVRRGLRSLYMNRELRNKLEETDNEDDPLIQMMKSVADSDNE